MRLPKHMFDLTREHVFGTVQSCEHTFDRSWPVFLVTPVRYVVPTGGSGLLDMPGSAPAGSDTVGRKQEEARMLRQATAPLRAFIISTVVAVTGLLLLNTDHAAAEADAETVAYTVQRGDNLWDIATRGAGNGDIWGSVGAIKKLNDLDTSVITPGQVLLLPAEG